MISTPQMPAIRNTIFANLMATSECLRGTDEQQKKMARFSVKTRAEKSRNSPPQERRWPGVPAESAGTQKARKPGAYKTKSQRRSRMPAAPMPPPMHMVTMP